MKKLFPIILTTISLLVFTGISIAQENEKEARIKVITIKNGEKMVLDTTIHNEHFEVEEILESLGLEDEIEITMDIEVDGNEDHIVYTTESDIKVDAKAIVLRADHSTGEKPKIISIQLDSEKEIRFDDLEEFITMKITADLEDLEDGLEECEKEIMVTIDAMSDDLAYWKTVDGDSLVMTIKANMDDFSKELEGMDIDLSVLKNLDKDIFVHGLQQDITFYGNSHAASTTEISDLTEQQWEYFKEWGYSKCRETFTPMNLRINSIRGRSGLGISFNVIPDQPYKVILLNEDLTPLLDEEFKLKAGSYKRNVDISSDHNKFYIQIVKGKSCYTKCINIF